MTSLVRLTVISTAARPNGYRPVLAKTHGPRIGQVGKYDNAKYFRFEVVEIRTIEELLKLLRMLAKNPHYAIVRAVPAPDVDFSQPQRRLLDKQSDGSLPTLQRGASVWWAAFDLDCSQPAPGMDWRTHPREAAKAIALRDLPKWATDADFVAYWSGSQGFSPVMKLRVFILLEQPMTSAEFKKVMKPLVDRGETSVDLALYSDAQLHYTATPIFEGSVVDPLPNNRHFLFKRTRRRALVPAVQPALNANPRRSLTTRARTSRRSGLVGTAPVPRIVGGRGGSSSAAIGAVIATMGEQSEGKAGFHVPWNRALAIFFAQNGPDADPRPLIVRLARVIVSRGSRDEAYFQAAVRGMVRRARVLAALERERRDTLTKLRAAAHHGLTFNAEKETSHG